MGSTQALVQTIGQNDPAQAAQSPSAHAHAARHSSLKRTRTWISKRRKLRPVWLSLSSTESVIACPDSDVPAARNVTGTPSRRAMGKMRAISSSVCTCGRRDAPKSDPLDQSCWL